MLTEEQQAVVNHRDGHALFVPSQVRGRVPPCNPLQIGYHVTHESQGWCVTR
jgi:hypothetical protein